MTTTGLYEQIGADLGDLKLDAAASSFVAPADQARTDGWSGHCDRAERL